VSKPTVGSLFSGLGGLDLAAHWAGFETAWFVEKEPFCQKILNKHWPNTPIYNDVFNVAGSGYGKEGQTEVTHVDIICGGFP
jgi:DNA (cytosine-5)-methyltransferase 1